MGKAYILELHVYFLLCKFDMYICSISRKGPRVAQRVR